MTSQNQISIKKPDQLIASRRSKTIGFIILLIPFVLLIDSHFVSSYLGYPTHDFSAHQRPFSFFDAPQLIATLVMIAAFIAIYRDAPRRLRALMKYGVAVGLVGEIIFSILLGMYEYRLANVPLYIPLGHSILYAAIYYFVREPWVIQNGGKLQQLLFGIVLIYGAAWYFYDNDLYGILCMVLFIFILASAKESRMFFLSMYLLIAYLEQVGTRLGCWYWPETAFGSIALLPSGNPPSAISVFYFGFDAACVWIYLVRKPALRSRRRRLYQ